MTTHTFEFKNNPITICVVSNKFYFGISNIMDIANLDVSEAQVMLRLKDLFPDNYVTFYADLGLSGTLGGNAYFASEACLSFLCTRYKDELSDLIKWVYNNVTPLIKKLHKQTERLPRRVFKQM